MGLISYTTLASLIAGAPEKIADVVDCLQKIQTVVNGQVDGTNAPAITGAYGDPLLRGAGQIGPTFGAATYLIKADAAIAFASGVADNSGSGHQMHIALAAAYGVTGVTTKLRIRPWVMVNAAAPAINFTFGLHPVSAVAGAAGITTVTVGAAVAGSTVAINAPSASAVTPGTGPDFNYSLLTDGIGYMLGVTTSGAPAASSVSTCGAILELHRS